LDVIGLSPELTEAEKTQFVSVCKAFGLNPWKREVYATVYGEGSYRRFSVIVGYETYLKRAERTGRLDGWSSRIEGTGNDMKAIVEIHRRDWSQPLIHEVYFTEAVQKKKDGTPTSFWSKMPRFQLKKVCISQAFRLCFPDELGGLPFDASELPDAETVATPTVPNPTQVPPAAASSPVHQTPPEMPPKTPTAILAEEALSDTTPPKAEDHRPPQPDTAAETVQSLQDQLTAFLDEHYTSFTEKHRDWILNMAWKAHDPEGVRKMLRYAQKSVRNTAAVAGATA
jgi:phage recombination protein Bet